MLEWSVRDVETGEVIESFARYWLAAALRTEKNGGTTLGRFDVFCRV